MLILLKEVMSFIKKRKLYFYKNEFCYIIYVTLDFKLMIKFSNSKEIQGFI